MNSRKQGRLKRVEFYAVIAFVLVVCVSILFVSVTVAFAVRRSVINNTAIRQNGLAPNAPSENTLASTSSVQGASSQGTAIQGTPFQSAALQNASAQSVSDPNSASSSSAMELSTVSGMVTDSYCGARHSRNSNRSSTECVRYCTHRGAGYILVSSGGVYMLRGNRAMFNRFAGQRAKVTGTLDGKVIGVRSMVASE